MPERSFAEYVEASGPRLKRLAFLLTGDLTEAEDLLQTAYARVLPHWDRVSTCAVPDAYLRKVMVSIRTSWWRRHRNRERLVADPPEHNAARSVAGAGIGEAVVENQVLLAALAALPERQRAAVVLRHWCDLSAAETAETMGCTIGTVKSSTSKGLAHLRAASALTGTSSWKESSSGETSRVLLSGSGVPAVAGEADLDGDGASEVPVLSRERDRESWTVLTVAEGGVVAAVPVGP